MLQCSPIVTTFFWTIYFDIIMNLWWCFNVLCILKPLPHPLVGQMCLWSLKWTTLCLSQFWFEIELVPTHKTFQFLFVFLMQEDMFLMTGQRMCYFVTFVTFVLILTPVFFLQVCSEVSPWSKSPFAQCANGLLLLAFP